MSAQAAISIEFPREDLRAFQHQIERMQKELGMTLKKSVQWAGVKLCDSLSASTKVAPKLRKVVANPDARAKTDGRRAKFGVYRYVKGRKVFTPIYRTGEYGKIRFTSKSTGERMFRDPTTGEVHRVTWDTGTQPDQMPGIAQSPKRKIGRSGLAKKVWRWAKARCINGGRCTLMGPNIKATVDWKDLTNNPTLVIDNKLRYAVQAFRGGRQDVSAAMIRAADGMRKLINDKVKALQK